MKRAILLLSALAASAASAAPSFDSGVVSGLNARNIGSATMSGRIAALTAHSVDGKLTIYVGAASGGVWKSKNGGTTFEPIFDKNPIQSIGAITLDPKNPQTVWVGTGETWTRNSVSIGDGIYKSTDGGDSWLNMGLPESERISKIIVDPTNSSTVYACVPGKLWSDSKDRGLYKTTDGGVSWRLILKGSNLSTGCGAITMDAKNPGVLLASLWDFRRQGWTFRSGGNGPAAKSGSALYRSTDGGANWTELTDVANAGIPKKPWGRVEVEIAPSDSNIVYAMIEGTRSALFRSADGGKTWEERDRSQMMVWRPFYFSQIIVDPKNADRVFKTNLRVIVSTDGGKSFSDTAGNSHADSHDIWINPENTQQLVMGDDGGIWYSDNGGVHWWKGGNLPISQFYHVSVDDQDPFQVYGGLQDNSSWAGDSSYPGGVTNSRWENMYGGDGFWTFSDPADPDYIYAESQGGNIGRVNRRTRQVRDIQPKAGYGEKLRFNWNTPIHLSPNARGTLYIGAQFLFRSSNQGQSWDRISPDLTTNDLSKQQQELSGGITVDNSSAEMHTTIYSISESPVDPQVIWVGTDDGNVQLSTDGAKSWKNVVGQVRGMQKASWVSWVEASRHDAKTAYVVFDRHTVGDMNPYIYKTTDSGQSWQLIASAALGLKGYAHVIKEDPLDPNVLFAGTEKGLWISIDGGAQWAEFKGSNFPSVAVRDIAIQSRDNDLVIATHGRGIWIIDDISPLRNLKPEVLNGDASFVSARPVQQRILGNGGWSDGDAVFVGDTAPDGAVITYYQKSRHLFGKLRLEILDSEGKLIDTIATSKRRGINRVEWSMRVKPPRVPQAAQVAFSASQGPRVVPGDYTVRLTKGDQVYEAPLKISLDRRAKFSVDDRRAQFDAVMRVHTLFGRMSDLVDQINGVKMAAGQKLASAKDDAPLSRKLESVLAKADELRGKIVATKEGGAITGEERIRENTDSIYGALNGYEGRPGDYQLARVEALERELKDVEVAFADFKNKQVDGLALAIQIPAHTHPPGTASARLLSRYSPFELNQARAFHVKSGLLLNQDN